MFKICSVLPEQLVSFQLLEFNLLRIYEIFAKANNSGDFALLLFQDYKIVNNFFELTENVKF